MAVRFKHSESITVGKEGIKLGGSFLLTSDELGRLEAKDVKRKVGSLKDGIRGRAHNSVRFIGRKRTQLGKIARSARGFNRV